MQSPRSTSVTRRAAGLPVLILCVLSAAEGSKAKPLLAHSIQTLLETAKTPLPERWDQTLDLPQVCGQGNKKEDSVCVCVCVTDVIVFFPFQVCAVHTLQALVRGSGLGVAVLQFAPAVAMLSLTLLSSPCWAMRNAALQLYSKTPAHSGSCLTFTPDTTGIQMCFQVLCARGCSVSGPAARSVARPSTACPRSPSSSTTPRSSRSFWAS